MQALAKQIITDFDHLSFEDGETFMWSPSARSIHYVDEALEKPAGLWSLLHEIGHAELAHTTYKNDFHLLIMEVQAWSKAKELAAKYEVMIDEGHIEHCIDSYRDWLHKRSKCVECGVNAFQFDHVTYHCHNCSAKWKVPASKICKVRKRRI